MWRLIKSSASSRGGQILCAVNLALVGYFYFFSMAVPADNSTFKPSFDKLSFVGNGGFIAGGWVDFDSSLLLPLILLNLLPLLISNVVINPIIEFVPQLNAVVASWVYAGLLLALISMQWLVVGSFIEKMFKLFQGSRQETPHRTKG